MPYPLAEPFERRANRRRVVREIVVDADAPRLPAQLHATAHAGEAAERGDRLGGIDADMARGGDGGQGV